MSVPPEGDAMSPTPEALAKARAIRQEFFFWVEPPGKRGPRCLCRGEQQTCELHYQIALALDAERRAVIDDICVSLGLGGNPGWWSAAAHLRARAAQEPDTGGKENA